MERRSVDLAQILQLPERYVQDQEIIIQAVLRWFRLHTNWLLIYDNIDDLSIVEPFLPKAGSGHLLFTTRTHDLRGSAQRWDVQIMPPDVGALLLLRRAGILPLNATLDMATPEDLTIARAISEELGGLPLALDQAGAYIKETPCLLQDYLARYRTRRQDLLGARGSFDQDYPASVATTWSLAFEKISQVNSVAAQLLEFCAFLAPDPIPEELLIAGASHLGAALASVVTNPVQLDQVCKELLRYSLLQHDADARTLRIHRLVQVMLQDNLPTESSMRWKQRAVLAMNATSPHVQDFGQWEAYERWLPHALVCASWTEQEDMTFPEAAHLLNEAGCYLENRARYGEAEPLLMRALAIYEQQLGADHPNTVQTLNNLAMLHHKQDKDGGAAPFLISYTHEDLPWAKWIAQQLEKAGYSTILPDRDFLPGSNLALEMDSATKRAVRTIAVLSADYLASKFTPSEWAAAFRRDPRGEQGLLLLVRVKPCDTQGLLRQLIYIDLVDKDEQKAREVLLAEVQRIPRTLKQTPFPSDAAPEHVPFPGTQPTPSRTRIEPARFGAPFPEVWNVPRRHIVYYTGRDNLLQQLFQRFSVKSAAGASIPQALVGLGGIGKTQTAAEYAYRYRGAYQAVLWVRAQTKESLAEDFKACALLLNLHAQESLIETIQQWFRYQTDWLLILDNADDFDLIAPFLPQAPRGHILLTTRTRALSNVAQPLVLGPLEPEDGALCILRRAGVVAWNGQLSDASPPSANAARALAQLMNGLPLALEQAGAYIDETGSSTSRYLALYQQYRSVLQDVRFGAVPDYAESVASAWRISMSLVERENPAAAELLRWYAFLAPDAIPSEIVIDDAATLGPVLESLAADPLALDNAIRLLCRHSLIHREVDHETDTSRLFIHPIVQGIIKDHMDQPTQRLWATRAARIVDYDPLMHGRKAQIEVRRGNVMIVGAEGELVLRVTNGTVAPMEEIDIELTRSAEYDHLTPHRVTIPSLPPQGSTEVRFRLCMKVAGRVSINYLVNGEMRDPPISVYTSRDNPYIYGNPIDEGEFFGRQEELEAIVQAMTKPVKQDILVVGERRTGKTSLLYQVGKKPRQ